MTTTIIIAGTLGTIPDNYIDEAASTTNNGTNSNIRILPGGSGTENSILMQFGIQSLAELKGQKITNAKLEIYTVSAGSHVAGTIIFRQILKANAETQSTWRNATSLVTWKTSGCKSETSTQTETSGPTGEDRYSVAADNVADFAYTPPILSNQYVTFIDNDPVFTEYINELKDGLWSEDRGFFIGAGAGSSVTFVGRSSDHTTANTRPMLTLTHRPIPAFFCGFGFGN